MLKRYDLSRICTLATLLLLSPHSWASCTPDWVDARASHWCFAFGGTLDADVRQAGAGDEINRVNRQADGPIVAGDRHRLGIGIHYDTFELDEPVAANLDMYRIELRYRLQLGEDSALQLAPALATSSNRIFDDMRGDDFLLQAALTHRFGPDGILAGVVHDARLGGGLRTYPVFSAPLSLDNDVHGTVGFPDSRLDYAGRNWNWTLRLGPRGYSWHVLDDDGNFRFDVKLERWELGMSAVRQRQPGFYFDFGIAFAREIHYTTSLAQRVETRLDSALFLAVGLRLGSLDANSKAQRE